MSKRTAERQLTKDDYDDESEVAVERGMDMASAEEIAQRKIRKVKRKLTPGATAGEYSQPTNTSSTFNFGTGATDTQFTWSFGTTQTKSAEEQLNDAKQQVEDLKKQVEKLKEENEKLKSGDKTSAPSTNDSQASTTGFVFDFGKPEATSQQESQSNSQLITPTPTSSFFDFSGSSFSGMNEASFGATSDSLPKWGESSQAEDANPEEEANLPFSVDPDIQKQLTDGPVSSGEEDETNLFSEKCKLYELSKTDSSSTWQERGAGIVRLNTLKDGTKVRILMRKQTVLTVLLNIPIFKQMKIQKSGKGILFNAPKENNEIATYSIKFQSQDSADRLTNLLNQEIAKL